MNFPLLSHRRTLPILYASRRHLRVQFFPCDVCAASNLGRATPGPIGPHGRTRSGSRCCKPRGSLDDRVQAEALRIQIDREYLRWGLKELRGLEIDGVPAESESLFERGPEDLMNEIVSRIRAECELSGEERKN